MATGEDPSVEEFMTGTLETEHTVELNRGDIDPISLRRYEGQRSSWRPLMAVIAVLGAVVTLALLAVLRR